MSQPVRSERIDKPWGHEIVWAHTDKYAGKILHVRSGHALSLQYHRRKQETLSVLRGRVVIEHGPSAAALVAVELGPGEGLDLPAGTVHRLTAREDSDVLEASTPELDDVVRLEDRYGRAET